VEIQVLLFASYAEALGASTLVLEVQEGASVGDVVAGLRTRAGGDRLPPSPLVAINQAYAAAGERVRAGDEVAIIPPVAGG
jgi:molybdopterin converting factor small subunit